VPLTYFAILTDLGLIRLAEAQYLGVPLVFVDMAIGDGSGAPIVPLSSMTELVNERARVAVNGVEISPDAPSTVRVEGLFPSGGPGGFTIREAGLFNAANEMIAIASYPPIYKPTPAEGATVDEYIRILIEYAAVTAIALTVDPAVIIATRLYVDDSTAGMLYLWENFT
jgi:phage-related tail fiber protein